MRRLLFFALLLIPLAYLIAAPISQPFGGYQVGAERPATLQGGWQYARAATGYVDAADAALDATTMIWQNTGTYFVIPYEWQVLSLAFWCYGDGDGAGDPASGSFDVEVYVAEPYSSWDHVCNFTVAVGGLQTTHHPVTGAELNSGAVDTNYKWAEGLFSSTVSYAWPGTPSYTGCSDGIGRVNFDPYGARVLIVRVRNLASVTRVYPLVKGR